VAEDETEDRSERLETGKLPSALMAELLAAGPELPREVLLGPRVGEDACAIEVGGEILVATTDPITLTGREIGRHAVVINANDVAVTGARPRYFLTTILLPPGTRAGEVREIFASIRGGLASLGASLVGGHTEVTTAVNQPVVIGQMLGVCRRNRLVPTGGARPGDRLVQVGEAPVEGAAVFASEPALARRLLGVDPGLRMAASAAAQIPGISVVEAALLAVDLGARALHDPTEGGLASGLVDVAEASGVRLDIEEEAVLWFEPGRALCAALGADPWGTLASGTLLAVFEADRCEAAVTALCAQGHRARAIGRVEQGSGVFGLGGRAIPRIERDEVTRVLASALR